MARVEIIGIVARLCSMSEEAREEYWPHRKPEEMQTLWRLPPIERFALLPYSERRHRCPACAGMIGKYLDQPASCCDCGKAYPERVASGGDRFSKPIERVQAKPPSHGFERIDSLAANAYVQGDD